MAEEQFPLGPGILLALIVALVIAGIIAVFVFSDFGRQALKVICDPFYFLLGPACAQFGI